jgi:hypothetical protein
MPPSESDNDNRDCDMVLLEQPRRNVGASIRLDAADTTIQTTSLSNDVQARNSGKFDTLQEPQPKPPPSRNNVGFFRTSSKGVLEAKNRYSGSSLWMYFDY